MIKFAEYVTTFGSPKYIGDEYSNVIGIVGKSNVGKSSFINYICNNKNLARTSKVPGKTRNLNLFKINKGDFYFLDFPGYGYAEVSQQEKERWGQLINDFFINNTKVIKHVFVLVDLRHKPTEDDIQMTKFLYYYNIAFTVIATKMDKLKKYEINNNKTMIAKTFGVGVDNIIPISALEKKGADLIYNRLDTILSI